MRIGEQRPCHGDEIRVAVIQHAFRDIRHVDAIGRDNRNADDFFQPPGGESESATRHRIAYGGHCGLMPTNADVEQVGPRTDEGTRQRVDVIRALPLFNQICDRHAIRNNGAAAQTLARAPHDFHRTAYAVLDRPAPLVAAVIHAQRDALVEEIAFRSHEFDAVIAGANRQFRAAHEVVYGGFDLRRRQHARNTAIDR